MEREAANDVLLGTGSIQQREKLALRTKVLYCSQEPPILLYKQQLY